VNRLRQKDDPISWVPFEYVFPKNLIIEPHVSQIPAAVKQENIVVADSPYLSRKVVIVIAAPDVQLVLCEELLRSKVDQQIADICVKRIVDVDAPSR
jgi:hypothetical protein